MIFPIITIWVGLVITIGIAIYHLRNYKVGWWILSNAAWTMGITIVAAVASLIIPCVVSSFVQEYGDRTETEVWRIYSLRDITEVEGSATGSFLIGHGYIGNALYYYVLREGRHGGYVMRKYCAEEYEIREVDTQPQIERRWAIAQPKYWIFGLYSKFCYYKVIDVPVGTVIIDYQVDMQ